MKPAPFELKTPRTFEEALDLLSAHGASAKVLAGGQSLVPMMNMRLATPQVLIDLNRIEALAYLRDEGGHIAIGALARHRDLETSELLKRACPITAEAAGKIGHLAIRYRGTLGGTLAHADPAATLPTVVRLLDGTICAKGPAGQREIAAADFFLGYFMTALDEAELIYEVRIPKFGPHTGHGFYTASRRHGDFPLVSVGALVERDGPRMAAVKLVVGGVNPTAERIAEAEDLLAHGEPTEDLFRQAADMAASALDAEGDIHASAAYRLHLVRHYTHAALQTAWSRAKGEDR